jgi:hypothetical protein
MESTATAVQNAVQVHRQVEEVPITRVIVYSDRAQVTRLVRLPVPTADKQILLRLDGISTQCEAESIRVEVEGGLAVLDVSHRTIRTKKEEQPVDTGEDKVRSRELARLAEERKGHEQEAELLRAEKVLIDGFGTTMVAQHARRSVMNEGSLEAFDAYWQYQRKEGRDLDTKSHELAMRIKEINTAYRRLEQQGVKPAEEVIVTTQISVLFETVEDELDTLGKATQADEYVAYVTYGKYPIVH